MTCWIRRHFRINEKFVNKTETLRYNWKSGSQLIWYRWIPFLKSVARYIFDLHRKSGLSSYDFFLIYWFTTPERKDFLECFGREGWFSSRSQRSFQLDRTINPTMSFSDTWCKGKNRKKLRRFHGTLSYTYSFSIRSN